MLIKWYSQLEVNKASNVVGVSSGCLVRRPAGCDSPEKWLELCITKRILRPFAAHAYISAQIVIRGPSDPTKPTARPTWPTFRATDQAVTWFCISGNGKADENVMRSFYKGVSEGRGAGWGVSDDWQRCAASNRPNSRTVQFRRPDLWLTSRWWTAAGEGHFLSLPHPPKSAIHWRLSRPHFPARFTRQRNKAEN